MTDRTIADAREEGYALERAEALGQVDAHLGSAYDALQSFDGDPAVAELAAELVALHGRLRSALKARAEHSQAVHSDPPR